MWTQALGKPEFGIKWGISRLLKIFVFNPPLSIWKEYLIQVTWGCVKKTLTILLSALFFPNGSVFTQSNQLVTFPVPLSFSLWELGACLLKRDSICEVPSTGPDLQLMPQDSVVLYPVYPAGSQLTCKCSIDPTANTFWLRDESTQKKEENYLNYLNTLIHKLT